jgi:hypothetical protein
LDEMGWEGKEWMGKGLYGEEEEIDLKRREDR